MSRTVVGRNVVGRNVVGRTVVGRSDRGSASIWVLACSALVLLAAVTLVIRTGATLASHRAEFAADAAALAAAAQIGVQTQPCSTAARIAASNDARLSGCRVNLADDGRSGQVAVVVTVDARLPILGADSVRASAYAARDPGQMSRSNG